MALGSIARFKELGLIEVRISKSKGNRRAIWPVFQPDELCKKKHIAIAIQSWHDKRR